MDSAFVRRKYNQRVKAQKAEHKHAYINRPRGYDGRWPGVLPGSVMWTDFHLYKEDDDAFEVDIRGRLPNVRNGQQEPPNSARGHVTNQLMSPNSARRSIKERVQNDRNTRKINEVRKAYAYDKPKKPQSARSPIPRKKKTPRKPTVIHEDVKKSAFAGPIKRRTPKKGMRITHSRMPVVPDNVDVAEITSPRAQTKKLSPQARFERWLLKGNPLCVQLGGGPCSGKSAVSKRLGDYGAVQATRINLSDLLTQYRTLGVSKASKSVLTRDEIKMLRRGSNSASMRKSSVTTTGFDANVFNDTQDGSSALLDDMKDEAGGLFASNETQNDDNKKAQDRYYARALKTLPRELLVKLVCMAMAQASDPAPIRNLFRDRRKKKGAQARPSTLDVEIRKVKSLHETFKLCRVNGKPVKVTNAHYKQMFAAAEKTMKDLVERNRVIVHGPRGKGGSSDANGSDATTGKSPGLSKRSTGPLELPALPSFHQLTKSDEKDERDPDDVVITPAQQCTAISAAIRSFGRSSYYFPTPEKLTAAITAQIVNTARVPNVDMERKDNDDQEGDNALDPVSVFYLDDCPLDMTAWPEWKAVQPLMRNPVQVCVLDVPVSQLQQKIKMVSGSEAATQRIEGYEHSLKLLQSDMESNAAIASIPLNMATVSPASPEMLTAAVEGLGLGSSDGDGKKVGVVVPLQDYVARELSGIDAMREAELEEARKAKRKRETEEAMRLAEEQARVYDDPRLEEERRLAAEEKKKKALARREALEAKRKEREALAAKRKAEADARMKERESKLGAEARAQRENARFQAAEKKIVAKMEACINNSKDFNDIKIVTAIHAESERFAEQYAGFDLSQMFTGSRETLEAQLNKLSDISRARADLARGMEEKDIEVLEAALTAHMNLKMTEEPNYKDAAMLHARLLAARTALIALEDAIKNGADVTKLGAAILALKKLKNRSAAAETILDEGEELLAKLFAKQLEVLTAADDAGGVKDKFIPAIQPYVDDTNIAALRAAAERFLTMRTLREQENVIVSQLRDGLTAFSTIGNATDAKSLSTLLKELLASLQKTVTDSVKFGEMVQTKHVGVFECSSEHLLARTEAEAALKKMQRTLQGITELKAAMASGDVDLLRSELNEAQASGVPEPLIVVGQNLLAVWLKIAAASDEVRAAMAAKDVKALHSKLQALETLMESELADDKESRTEEATVELMRGAKQTRNALAETWISDLIAAENVGALQAALPLLGKEEMDLPELADKAKAAIADIEEKAQHQLDAKAFDEQREADLSKAQAQLTQAIEASGPADALKNAVAQYEFVSVKYGLGDRARVIDTAWVVDADAKAAEATALAKAQSSGASEYPDDKLKSIAESGKTARAMATALTEQAAALTALISALTSRDVNALTKAIATAHQAGLTHDRLQEAEDMLTVLTRGTDLLSKLRAAMENKSDELPSLVKTVRADEEVCLMLTEAPLVCDEAVEQLSTQYAAEFKEIMDMTAALLPSDEQYVSVVNKAQERCAGLTAKLAVLPSDFEQLATEVAAHAVVLALLLEQHGLITELDKAVTAADSGKLHTAISASEEFVERNPDAATPHFLEALNAAKALYDKLTTEAEAMRELGLAVTEGTYRYLKDALADVTTLGVSNADVDAAKALLAKLEGLQNLIQEIKEAVADGNLERLETAVLDFRAMLQQEPSLKLDEADEATVEDGVNTLHTLFAGLLESLVAAENYGVIADSFNDRVTALGFDDLVYAAQEAIKAKERADAAEKAKQLAESNQADEATKADARQAVDVSLTNAVTNKHITDLEHALEVAGDAPAVTETVLNDAKAALDDWMGKETKLSEACKSATADGVLENLVQLLDTDVKTFEDEYSGYHVSYVKAVKAARDKVTYLKRKAERAAAKAAKKAAEEEAAAAELAKQAAAAEAKNAEKDAEAEKEAEVERLLEEELKKEAENEEKAHEMNAEEEAELHKNPVLIPSVASQNNDDDNYVASESDKNEFLSMRLSAKLASKTRMILATNPFVVISRWRNPIWEKITVTNVIRDSLTPTFNPLIVRVFDLCHGQYDRELKFDLYDFGKIEEDPILIGTVETTLRKIKATIDSGESMRVVKNPKKRGSKQVAQIWVNESAIYLNTTKAVLTNHKSNLMEVRKKDSSLIKITLKMDQLPKMDQFGMCDPFFQVLRLNDGFEAMDDDVEGKWSTMYTSETVVNNNKPTYEAFVMPASELCYGDYDKRFKISVLDWNANSKADPMCSLITSVRELGKVNRKMRFYDDRDNPQKNVGYCVSARFDIFTPAQFKNYLQQHHKNLLGDTEMELRNKVRKKLGLPPLEMKSQSTDHKGGSGKAAVVRQHVWNTKTHSDVIIKFQCSELPRKDAIGWCDAYVDVRRLTKDGINWEKIMTSAPVLNQKHPEFDAITFKLKKMVRSEDVVNSLTKDMTTVERDVQLVVKLWDYDQFGDDDYIGQVVTTLSELKRLSETGGRLALSNALEKKATNCGFLKVASLELVEKEAKDAIPKDKKKHTKKKKKEEKEEKRDKKKKKKSKK